MIRISDTTALVHHPDTHGGHWHEHPMPPSRDEQVAA